MPARDNAKASKTQAPSTRSALPGAAPQKIAIVWAEFNSTITEEMRDRAIKAVRHHGFEAAPVVSVAGSYDLPFAVDRALSSRSVVAAVAIGCIVTGETRHDEVIAHACAQGLVDVSLARGKPVGLGVTGPGQDFAKAQARVDRAEAAVDAVVKLLSLPK